MARYNHFSNYNYKQIMFSSVIVGGKFRRDFFKNGRRRANIVCKKTGTLSYIEERSKKEHTFLITEIIVSSYEEKMTEQIPVKK